MKTHINLSVEGQLILAAKKEKINVSELMEHALMDKLNSEEVKDIVQRGNCDFCGKEDRKATPQDVEGLNWLYPDEKWICLHCLKDKMDRVPIGQK